MKEIDTRKHAIILGGAGKMGRGIALVLLRAFAGDEQFSLTLMDVNASVFPGVEAYLRTHMQKHPLGESVCDRIHFTTSLAECRPADVVYEAVIEDVEGKAKILKNAAEVLGPHPYFFSNTSSIPIHLLGELSGLSGRLVGFHFYNPPPVQKLVELIIPEDASGALRVFADQTVAKLQKSAVYSNDVAGFIGNGHLIREVVVAWGIVGRLAREMSLEQAIVCVNTLYQEWLLRPMGIFQLVDYVGVDVCAAIMKIMGKYVPDETIRCPYLDQLLALGVRGGQQADGVQKPGIFEYVEGKPVGVFSVETGVYGPYFQEFLGDAPEPGMSWKALVKDPEKGKKLKMYFKKLYAMDTVASRLAVEMLAASKGIAEGLVERGVARSIADVNTVLQQGFYHLYGAE